MIRRALSVVHHRRFAAVGLMGCLLVSGAVALSPGESDPASLHVDAGQPLLEGVRAIKQVDASERSNDYVSAPRPALRPEKPEESPSRPETYTVVAGDTLWLIARRFETDLESIQGLNPTLDPMSLVPGLEISVRPGPRALANRGLAGVRRPPAPTESVKPRPVASAAPAAPPGEPRRPGWVWPVAKRLSFSEYGYREDGFHRGLDIAAPIGTPAVAVQDGTVTFSGWDGGFGYCVVIDHGDGVVTRYAHASQLVVKSGQTVKQGQTVILVGNTGNSTGPHLHLEVIIQGELVNPRQLLP